MSSDPPSRGCESSSSPLEEGMGDRRLLILFDCGRGMDVTYITINPQHHVTGYLCNPEMHIHVTGYLCKFKRILILFMRFSKERTVK